MINFDNRSKNNKDRDIFIVSTANNLITYCDSNTVTGIVYHHTVTTTTTTISYNVYGERPWWLALYVWCIQWWWLQWWWWWWRLIVMVRWCNGVMTGFLKRIVSYGDARAMWWCEGRVWWQRACYSDLRWIYNKDGE